MKKILLLLMILSITTGGLFAQTFTSDQLIDAFEGFSEEVSTALPLAANIGLNWNDAYQKPGVLPVSVGVGLSAGAAFIPSEAFDSIANELGFNEVSDTVSQIPLGAPLPVYSLDARVGLGFIPMDFGVKFGTLPADTIKDFAGSGVGFEYTMVGFDARYALLKQKLIIPEVSVGGGYTFLSGNITMPGPDTQTVDMGGLGTFDIQSSDINFGWQSNVIDLKAQAAWKLVILNLSAGIGYSHGFSSAGGGFIASHDADATQQQALEDLGVDVSADGIEVISEVNGGSLRAFGGAGLNLGPIKWDFGVLYGLNSGSLGASTNFRFQI